MPGSPISIERNMPLFPTSGIRRRDYSDGAIIPALESAHALAGLDDAHAKVGSRLTSLSSIFQDVAIKIWIPIGGLGQPRRFLVRLVEFEDLRPGRSGVRVRVSRQLP